MPKRCHHCKSEDHLIADCPHRFNKNNVVIADEQSRDQHSEKQLATGVAGLSLSEGGGDVKRESNAWKWKWIGFFEPSGIYTLATPTPVEKWGLTKGEFFWGNCDYCYFGNADSGRESMFGNFIRSFWHTKKLIRFFDWNFKFMRSFVVDFRRLYFQKVTILGSTKEISCIIMRKIIRNIFGDYFQLYEF